MAAATAQAPAPEQKENEYDFYDTNGSNDEKEEDSLENFHNGTNMNGMDRLQKPIKGQDEIIKELQKQIKEQDEIIKELKNDIKCDLGPESKNAIRTNEITTEQDFFKNKEGINKFVDEQYAMISDEKDEVTKEFTLAKMKCEIAQKDLKTYSSELKDLTKQMNKVTDRESISAFLQVFEDLSAKISDRANEVDYWKEAISKYEDLNKDARFKFEFDKIKGVPADKIEKVKDLVKSVFKTAGDVGLNNSAGARQGISNAKEFKEKVSEYAKEIKDKALERPKAFFSRQANLRAFNQFKQNAYEIEKNELKQEIEDYKKNEKEIKENIEKLENKKEKEVKIVKAKNLWETLKDGINDIRGKEVKNVRYELPPEIENSIKDAKESLLKINESILKKEQDLVTLMEQTISECTKGEYLDKDGNKIENTVHSRFINIREELENAANEIREEQQDINKDIRDREARSFDDDGEH